MLCPLSLGSFAPIDCLAELRNLPVGRGMESFARAQSSWIYLAARRNHAGHNPRSVSPG